MTENDTACNAHFTTTFCYSTKI